MLNFVFEQIQKRSVYRFSSYTRFTGYSNKSGTRTLHREGDQDECRDGTGDWNHTTKCSRTGPRPTPCPPTSPTRQLCQVGTQTFVYK